MVLVKHFVELLINPYFLCLLFIGICTLLLWLRPYSVLLVRRILLIVLLVLIVISTGWLPKYMTYKLESQYPVVTQVDPEVRWVVVLGGGQTQAVGMPANNLLSSVSMKRLIEGIRLFRDLPQAKLVLSGGSSGDQPEALLLAELARWFAIPQQKIVLELKSINTVEQVHELASIVKREPFYLVTSAVHMSRSMDLCHRLGLHPIAAPTDFTFFWSTDSWGKLLIPNAYNLTYFSIALHEMLGKVWAFYLKGQ